jgi:nicotinic acid mononucleotide adenylyltransferase
MKKAVIAWGRMNPPTIGHQKLVDRVVATAKRERGEPRIYLSHTQNPKKDPLSYREKIRMATRAFGRVVKPSGSRTIIELMKELQRDGYKEVVIVAGSDRVSEYKTLLNKYNGKDYTFDNIKVVSAGERDPDAEGAEGMSATKMRQAASGGDEKSFHSGAPTGLSKADKTRLFNLVRKGMLVEEIETLLEKLKKKSDVDEKDFSDAELKKAVDNMQEEDEEQLELDLEEEQIDERAPLTIQQRLKRSRQMKRLAPKMKRLRQIKKFRMAPTERLQARARKLAKTLLRKKFAGAKGGRYSSLSPSEKITIDRLVANKTPIIDKLAKRLLPMVRKKEIERIRQARKPKNESIDYISTHMDELYEKIKTPQDQDIKDREGTQPARYHTGLSKSTKAARDAQFKKQSKMASDNPAAYKPAPGDATAETKPSKYTKKFKDLFGEAKTIKVGADSVGADKTHFGLVKDRKVIDVGPKDDMLAASEEKGGRVWVTTKQVGDVVEGEAVRAARERIKREKEQDRAKHDAALDRARLQDTRAANRKEEFELTEKSMDALKTKAKKSGYSYGTLKKVYDRGVAAWRTGHRPGTTPQQWGYARVNAFVAKQKSGQKLNHDTDLANEFIPEHIHKNQLVYNPDKMTKNFDICPKAQKAFNDNQKAGLEPNEGFGAAVDAVDNYLGLEKKLVEKGSATEADLNRMKTMVDIAKQKISDADLPGHNYHQIHIDVVKDLVKDIKEGKAHSRAQQAAIVIAKKERGEYKEGAGLWHNIHKKRKEGRPMRKPGSEGAPTKQDFKNASENFMDGKGPGKPGDAARHGLKGKSPSELRKIRSSDSASPRKKQLAHWLLNFVHKEETQMLDESLQIEKGAGIGTFMTASDLGLKFQGAFEHHPSVQEEGGAGEEGTKKLKDKYKKETPEQ